MLAGANVLVVEDEMLIALELALAIEDARGVVVGPASTTREALMLIANAPDARMPITAAILDVNLADRDVTPVVMLLRRNDVPVIIRSAVRLPAAVQASYPDIPWLAKPCETGRVIQALAVAIRSGARCSAAALVKH